MAAPQESSALVVHFPISLVVPLSAAKVTQEDVHPVGHPGRWSAAAGPDPLAICKISGCRKWWDLPFCDERKQFADCGAK